MIFRGTFEHALDAKHRLTVPAKYRAALASGVVIAISPETEAGSSRSISLWIPDAYEAYTTAALAGQNPLSATTRSLKRMFLNNSWDTELDSAYRVMIPAPALQYAGLEKEVTIAGSGECLEVWDRAVYDSYNQAVMARYPEIVASLDHTH